VQANIHQTYKSFEHLKLNSSLCDMWLASLIEMQVEQKQMKKKTFWKQLWATKCTRHTALVVKSVLASAEHHGAQSLVIGPNSPSQGQQEFTTMSWNKCVLLRKDGGSLKQTISPFSQNPCFHWENGSRIASILTWYLYSTSRL